MKLSATNSYHKKQGKNQTPAFSRENVACQRQQLTPVQSWPFSPICPRAPAQGTMRAGMTPWHSGYRLAQLLGWAGGSQLHPSSCCSSPQRYPSVNPDQTWGAPLSRERGFAAVTGCGRAAWLCSWYQLVCAEPKNRDPLLSQ